MVAQVCEFCKNTFETKSPVTTCCGSDECNKKRRKQYYIKHSPRTLAIAREKNRLIREAKADAEANKNKKIYDCLKCGKVIKNNPEGNRLHDTCKKENELYDSSLVMGW